MRSTAKLNENQSLFLFHEKYTSSFNLKVKFTNVRFTQSLFLFISSKSIEHQCYFRVNENICHSIVKL